MTRQTIIIPLDTDADPGDLFDLALGWAETLAEQLEDICEEVDVYLDEVAVRAE